MTQHPSRRRPRVFDVDDPAVLTDQPPPIEQPEPPTGSPEASQAPDRTEASISAEPAVTPAVTPLRPAWTWTSMLVAAVSGLIALAFGVWFTQFASHLLARGGWIGWTAWALLVIAAASAVIIIVGEIVGLLRLARLASLKREAETALREGDLSAERHVVRRLRTALTGRSDLAWSLRRLREHEGDVRDPGELLALADREVFAPLDRRARQMVLASAKRVSLVAALSPLALFSVGYVLIENLRLMRQLASLYGGRPGYLGGLKLARMVFLHMVATGGLALTDDLFGQFIGHDIATRLSRRLGEGLFNGALTVRVGVAALHVCRPMPFVEAPPVRMRDVLADLMRRGDPTPAQPPANPV